MKRTLTIILTLTLMIFVGSTVFAVWDPADENKKAQKNSAMDDKVKVAIETFKSKDSDMKRFFKKAHGYAIFPTVGKGGIGIGAAYGKGLVFEKGKAIGRVSLKQISYGLQLGGQAYSQVIFFSDKNALNNFTDGNFEFGAGVSAVAITAGASADTDYDDGVAVFTMAKGGLMYEASISGQKFKFKPFK